jgi:ketosteroid isomerase-like protein
MIGASAVQPELDPELLELTREYLKAVDAGDLDALDAFYAPEFVNIRYDRNGRAINIPRDVFMGIVRGWAAPTDSETTGIPAPAAADRTDIIATSRYSDCASVLMLRVKDGKTVTYNFVWQHRNGSWLVLREFTLHDELPTPG